MLDGDAGAVRSGRDSAPAGRRPAATTSTLSAARLERQSQTHAAAAAAAEAEYVPKKKENRILLIIQIVSGLGFSTNARDLKKIWETRKLKQNKKRTRKKKYRDRTRRLRAWRKTIRLSTKCAFKTKYFRRTSNPLFCLLNFLLEKTTADYILFDENVDIAG